MAVIYDLKVFFTVIDVDPIDVRRRHVLEFIRVQRTGSTDAMVVPIDQSEGLALSTIRRRLSSLAGFYAHLVALGELDHNPVQRGMPVRSPVTRDRRVIPLVRPVRHLPRILDHDGVINLVAALRKDRDRAMIDAMLLAGLRRCEVLGVDAVPVRKQNRTRGATRRASGADTEPELRRFYEVTRLHPLEHLAERGPSQSDHGHSPHNAQRITRASASPKCLLRGHPISVSAESTSARIVGKETVSDEGRRADGCGLLSLTRLVASDHLDSGGPFVRLPMKNT